MDLKFLRKLSSAEQKQLLELYKNSEQLLGMLEAMRPIIGALIETHPDQKRLREVLYPLLLQASLDQPERMSARRRGFLSQIQFALNQLGLASPSPSPQSRPSGPDDA